MDYRMLLPYMNLSVVIMCLHSYLIDGNKDLLNKFLFLLNIFLMVVHLWR